MGLPRSSLAVGKDGPIVAVHQSSDRLLGTRGVHLLLGGVVVDLVHLEAPVCREGWYIHEGMRTCIWMGRQGDEWKVQVAQQWVALAIRVECIEHGGVRRLNSRGLNLYPKIVRYFVLMVN